MPRRKNAKSTGKRRVQRSKIVRSSNSIGLLSSFPTPPSWNHHAVDTESNKIYPFVRTNIAFSNFAQTATTAAFGSSYFSLDQFPNYTEFTALFDQYRIDQVEVTFYPEYGFNGLSVGPVATNVNPLLYVVEDYDDANAPTTLAELGQYQNCGIYDSTKPTTIKLRPHVAIAAYAGAFSSFGNRVSQWIDSASPSVQHYGLKFGCDAGAVGQTLLQTWQVRVRAALSFRNVR